MLQTPTSLPSLSKFPFPIFFFLFLFGFSLSASSTDRVITNKRAWVFAAGLVLGFSLLADDASDGDTREAFRGSQHVLHTIGRLSAQAAQYHQILSAFSEAIDIYRRQKRSERNESRVPFVEQILSYDDHPPAASTHHDNNHHNHNTTSTTSSFSGVSGNNMIHMRHTGGNDDEGDVFDQFIPRGAVKNVSHVCANIDELGQQQDRASIQEMGQPLQQLPTPDFRVDEPLGGGGGGIGAGAGGGGYWNESDTLSSMSTSDFLPEHWPPAADNELMLRLLWDGYTMGFDDPALLDGTRDTAV